MSLATTKLVASFFAGVATMAALRILASLVIDRPPGILDLIGLALGFAISVGLFLGTRSGASRLPGSPSFETDD